MVGRITQFFSKKENQHLLLFDELDWDDEAVLACCSLNGVLFLARLMELALDFTEPPETDELEEFLFNLSAAVALFFAKALSITCFLLLLVCLLSCSVAALGLVWVVTERVVR